MRPYDFVLSGIADAAGTVVNPQAADASGAVFLAAGAPFRATVTVRDAEGDATPNYGRESTPETVRLARRSSRPVGGASPAVGVDASGSARSERRRDGHAISRGPRSASCGPCPASATATTSRPATSRVAPSERIGRFVPSHFAVALNAPLFATACAAGGFTYQGQPFGYTTAPVITATAVAVGGTTTTNYTGAFFKLEQRDADGPQLLEPAAALDTSGLPADRGRSRDREPQAAASRR